MKVGNKKNESYFFKRMGRNDSKERSNTRKYANYHPGLKKARGKETKEKTKKNVKNIFSRVRSQRDI